ncbi:MAG: hypothetical protein JST04_17100 [Bdellovibrionales bacterium]|nr:hypothetical protein [Bdellovibrionales bacterium]
MIVSGVVLNGQLRALTPPRAMAVDIDESSFHWHPDLFRMLAFGQVPAAVDWLLIQFLSDTNITKTQNDAETAVYRVLDLATDLDPAFFTLYTIGGNYLSIIRGDRYGALKLVEKGERFRREELPKYPSSFREEVWENPWRVPMILGYLQLLEFQNIPAAREAYLEITKIPRVPIYVRWLAQGMQTARGRIRVARNSVEIIEKWYQDDPVMLAPVVRMRKLLDLAAALYDWNAEFAKRKKRDFAAFRRERGIPERDEFGGEIRLGADGRIDTPTAKEAVFGTTVDLLVRSKDNR